MLLKVACILYSIRLLEQNIIAKVKARKCSIFSTVWPSRTPAQTRCIVFTPRRSRTHDTSFPPLSNRQPTMNKLNFKNPTPTTTKKRRSNALQRTVLIGVVPKMDRVQTPKPTLRQWNQFSPTTRRYSFHYCHNLTPIRTGSASFARRERLCVCLCEFVCVCKRLELGELFVISSAVHAGEDIHTHTETHHDYPQRPFC